MFHKETNNLPDLPNSYLEKYKKILCLLCIILEKIVSKKHTGKIRSHIANLIGHKRYVKYGFIAVEMGFTASSVCLRLWQMYG